MKISADKVLTFSSFFSGKIFVRDWKLITSIYSAKKNSEDANLGSVRNKILDLNSFSSDKSLMENRALTRTIYPIQKNTENLGLRSIMSKIFVNKILTLSLFFSTNIFADIPKSDNFSKNHTKEENIFVTTPELITIYSTKKFTNGWGAGPIIKEIFEKEYNAKVKFISFDSPSSIVARLKLEKDKTKADIIMGLDLAQLTSEDIKDLIVEHKIDLKKLDNLPIEWKDKFMVPYDYGFVTFIYRDGSIKNVPKSFKELINSNEKFKIAISNPRSSNIGFDFLLWTAYVFGNNFEQNWKDFHDKKITIFSKNWADAWNLCMLGEVDVTLNYDTAAGYHKSQGEERLFKSMNFEEGHIIQLQMAAKIKKSANRELVQNFFNFIFRPEIQATISRHNFVHPVIKLKSDIASNNKAGDKNQRKVLFDPTKVTDIDQRKIIFDPENKFSDRAGLIKRWVKALTH